MHELFLRSPGELELRQLRDVPALKDTEARVKVIYGGICGSDIRVYRGLLPYAQYPCRPGHEILGIVTEAGSSCAIETGTTVVSFPNTYCGTCEFCAEGKTNICIDKKIFGVTVNGLFGNEVILDSEFLVPVPPGLTNERAILTEPFAVNVHALKKADITKDTTVAVIGCGTEGLLAIALLEYIGARITAIDINRTKMARAQEGYRSITTLHPDEAEDRRFDVVIEAAGAKEAIEQAFTLTKPGGTMITLGLTDADIGFPSMLVTRSEITIHGSIIYTKQDFKDAFTVLEDPAFNCAPVLSKIVAFENYQEAFADALTGNYTKIVMDFGNRND